MSGNSQHRHDFREVAEEKEPEVEELGRSQATDLSVRGHRCLRRRKRHIFFNNYLGLFVPAHSLTKSVKQKYVFFF